MKISLQCSGNIQKILTEVLTGRGILIDDTASVFLVEKGLPVPEHGVVVLFDAANLNELLEFLDELKPNSPSRSENGTVVGKKNDTFELIKLSEIIFFEGDNNTTYCQTRHSRYEVKKKLYELESSLGGKNFIRVNKSYLINVLMVNEIIPWFGGKLLLKFKELNIEVEVSRKNVPSFKNFIDM